MTPQACDRRRPMDVTDQGLIGLAVTGTIDSHTADYIGQRLRRLGASPRADLSHCTFIDSCGISMLIQVHEGALAAGGRLTLVEPSDCVIRLLTICGLVDRFSIDVDPRPPISASVPRPR